MSTLAFIQQIIDVIDEEVVGLENMIIDSGKSGDEPQNEFSQYVDLIVEIKKSASKSKLVIENILNNPEKLKYANSKLSDYGDLMKRMERLTSALDELEYKIAVKEFDFRTIDNILDIIDTELSETQSFHGIAEFSALQDRADTAKSALKKEIFKRYREIGIWSEIPMAASGRQIDSSSRASAVVESLRSANIIVDTLGEETVTELLEMLIQTQILPYHIRSGYEGSELFGLQKDQLDKRWEELYKVLGSSSAPHMQRILSSEWDVTFKMYTVFCRRTAGHLEQLLNKEVANLIPATRALRKTPSSAPSSADPISDERIEIDPGILQEHGNFVVQVLKSVIAIEQEVHKMIDDGVFAMSNSVYVSHSADKVPANRCFLMSSLFDRYLDPFIQSERRNVEDLIQTLVAEDVRLFLPSSAPEPSAQKASNNQQKSSAATTKEEVVDLIAYASAGQSVFNSAEMLFQTIRSSLLRCAAFSSGKPLLSLALEYKVCFQIYAETLRNSLCPYIPASAQQRVGKRNAFFLSLDDEILTCRSVITAERCVQLIPQIQGEIAAKLQSDLSGDIDMRAQGELFEDVSSHAVDILVGSLLGKANECLVRMVSTPWAKLTVVGDCSEYVRMLNSMLGVVIPRMRKVLPWKSFEALCFRFSSDFLDHFLALLMGLKKINVVGAEQLLLDINELKPMLLKLHFISLPVKSFERQNMQVSEKYFETVQKKSRLIEVVLKLICSDEEQIEETFYIMWPDGQDCDLRTIKSLKVVHPPSAAGSHSATPHSHGHDEKISSNDPPPGVAKSSRLGAAFGTMEDLRNKATNITDKFKIGTKSKS